MVGEIDFPYGLPIGYDRAGQPITANLDFWENLIRLLGRTGGSGADFISEAIAAAASAEATADGKITSVWQNDPPATVGFSEGDLWFDTNDGNKCYQLRAGAWVNAQDSAIGTAIGAAAGAQATANSRITTFYQTTAPTALAVGDLWHDTDDAQRRTYRWSGSAWVHITDQTAFNTAAAITSQGDLATTNRAALAFGEQALANTEFAVPGSYPPQGFVAGGGNQVGVTPTRSIVSASGRRAVKAVLTGTVSSGTYHDLFFGHYGDPNSLARYALAVAPGEVVGASALLAKNAAAAGIDIAIYWHDSAGNYVSESHSGAVTGNANGDTCVPSDYTYASIVATAPANTRFASIFPRLLYAASAVNATGWCMQPMLCRLPAGQTVVPPYTPGAVDRWGDQTSSNTAAAIAGQGALATMSAVTAAVLAVGVGKNCIFDGDFRQPINSYWSIGAQTGSVAAAIAIAGGIRYLQNAASGVTIGQVIFILSTPQAVLFPVVSGDRVEMSVYAGGSNGSSLDFYARWSDASGAFLSDTFVASTGTIGAANGDLTTYTRFGGFATAPTNARRCELYVRMFAATSAPVLRIAKPYIGKAASGQTELTPWNVGFDAVPGADITLLNTAAAITGQGPGATAVAADVLNAYAPLGANLLVNSDFANGLVGWDAGWDGTTGTAIDRGLGFVGYNETIQTIYAHAAGTPANGTVFDVYNSSTYLSLTNLRRWAPRLRGGERVYAGALMAGHRCRPQVVLVFYDNDGAYISGADFYGTHDIAYFNYGRPENADLVGGFATAPSNARFMTIIFRANCNGTGADPYIFVGRPQLAIVAAGQTVAPAYISGPTDRLADQTLSNTAAAVTGQGYWATAGALNVNGGVSGAFTAAPIASSTSTSITMAACDWSNPFTSLSLPSATLSGLSPSTRYYVFRDITGATYIPESNYATARTYLTDNTNRYLYCGNVALPSSGGGPGGGGGGGFYP